MIVLQSIMNFENGQVISYYDNDTLKSGTIAEVYQDLRTLLVLCDRGVEAKEITPFHVTEIHGKKLTPWSEKEKQTLFDNLHLSDFKLSLILNRSIKAIYSFKSRNGLKKRAA